MRVFLIKLIFITFLFLINGSAIGQGLVGLTTFQTKGSVYPSIVTVNNKGELVYCAVEYISDSASLFVAKYNPDLTQRDWVVKFPFNPSVRWYNAEIFTDGQGDIYLLYSRSFTSVTEQTVRVYKIGREAGDTMRVMALNNNFLDVTITPSGDLYTIYWIGDVPGNMGIMKMTLPNFEIAWQKEWNYGAIGDMKMVPEDDGVTIFTHVSRAPRLDGDLIQGMDVTGPVIMHLNSKGEATLKSISPLCCYYGFNDLIVNSLGDYYTLAAFPGTAIFGRDTIKAEFNYLVSGILGIDGSSGVVKKARRTSKYQYYDFRNLIWDRKGVLGSYSSGDRTIGVSKLVLLDQWDLREIWSKQIKGFITNLATDGQGSLFVVGDFENSLSLENQTFNANGKGYYIAKFDMNKMGMPELPDWNGTASIFPNPVDKELTIYFDRKVKPLTVKVFTNLGQLHSEYRGIKSRMKLNTELWESGTYYLQIHEDGEPVVTKKILKVAFD